MTLHSEPRVSSTSSSKPRAGWPVLRDEPPAAEGRHIRVAVDCLGKLGLVVVIRLAVVRLLDLDDLRKPLDALEL
eukprot:6714136-Prymnesium_polylepis.1